MMYDKSIQDNAVLTNSQVETLLQNNSNEYLSINLNENKKINLTKYQVDTMLKNCVYTDEKIDIIKNKNIPLTTSQIDELLNHRNQRVRLAVVENRSLTTSQIERMLQDGDPDVRLSTIMENAFITERLDYYAKNDPSSIVRDAVEDRVRERRERMSGTVKTRPSTTVDVLFWIWAGLFVSLPLTLLFMPVSIAIFILILIGIASVGIAHEETEPVPARIPVAKEKATKKAEPMTESDIIAICFSLFLPVLLIIILLTV